ncbi:MAG: hypothetical protein EXS67_03825 [Candidatus Margulisbacteria bacterium]|nr:hypothetical protein [Candidatus Margulisiibacteriota bacterium]
MIWTGIKQEGAKLTVCTNRYIPDGLVYGGPVTKHVDVFSVAINLARFLSGKDIAEVKRNNETKNSLPVEYVKSLVIKELSNEKLINFQSLLLNVIKDPMMTIDVFITEFTKLKLAIPA